MSSAELASIISSRICHDLVSPVGAIVNGIDLIREIGAGDCGDEISMISQSAGRAAALLQFYRVAFGAADPGDAPLSRQVLHDQASAMINSQRISLDWPDRAGPAVGRPEARMLYQALMCARAILGMRGTISVRMPADAALPLHIDIAGEANGTGQPATLNAEMANRLETTTDPIVPREVEFAMLADSRRELGLRMSITSAPGAMALVFKA